MTLAARDLSVEADRSAETPATTSRPRRVSAYDSLLLYVGCTSLAIIALVAVSLFSPVRALALGLLLTLAVVRLLGGERVGAFDAPLVDPWLVASLLLALFLRANISTNYMGGLDPGLYVTFSGVIEHTERTVLDPYGDGAPEQTPHFRRACGGREIPVQVRHAQQGVPHRPADAPGLETGILQSLGDGDHRARRTEPVEAALRGLAHRDIFRGR